MPEPVRVAVFVSGGGSNLQALIDRFHGDPTAPLRLALVVASRAGAGAVERAERAGIPARVLSPRTEGADAFPGVLLAALEEHRVDWIVLAGYLQLVPAAVVERYRGRMLNIHPALLPAFGGQGMYGARVHEAVLRAGARVSGATVHLVDERYDEGGIVAQWPVPVLAGDTAETLAARVLRVEHLLLPAALEALVGGRAPAAADPAAFSLVEAPAPELAALRRLVG